MIALAVATVAELLTIGVFRYVTPPSTPLMVLRAAQGDGAHRTWVPLERVSRDVIRAVIVSEDMNFCRHRGIDRGALRDAVASGGKFGGSTISNQVTRNVLLWPHRVVLRKLAELPLTGAVELAWKKRRILEMYLNVAEFGRGVFGVEEAAQRFWHMHAADLGPRRAALLAASLPNPRHSSPARPSAALRARARRVEVLVDRRITRTLTRCV